MNPVRQPARAPQAPDFEALIEAAGDLIYTLPFVLYGLFRYLYLLHRQGGGGDPSHDLFRDVHLIVAMAGWVVVTVLILR